MSVLSGIGDFAPDTITGGPYLYAENHSRVVWDAQVLQLPVAYVTGSSQSQAGPGYTQPPAARQACELVLAAAPVGKRIVTFYFVRWGSEPEAPDPTPASNETLIRSDVDSEAPILQPDGVTYIYSIRGTYVFALSQPLWGPTDDLPGAATPVGTDVAPQNDFPAEQFVPDLI